MTLSMSRKSARGAALASTLAIGLAISAGSVLAQDSSSSPDASAGALPPGVSAYAGAEAGSGEGLKIGYISVGDSIAFGKLVSDSVRAEVEKSGAEFAFCDSEVDAAKALECARNLKVQEVDGLINFNLFEDAAEQICLEGPQVPVVSVDIHQRPCERVFMGADNVRAGIMLGEAVGTFVKEQFDCQVDGVVLLTSQTAGEVVRIRSEKSVEGYANICGEPSNYTAVDVPSISIDEARTKFTDYLTTQPAAQRIVVMSLSDGMSQGALAAAEAVGRGGQVFVSSHDGAESVWKQIRCNPQWIGDVAYFPETYGTIAVPAVIDLIKGKDVAFDQFVDHVFLNAENITEIYPDTPACDA